MDLVPDTNFPDIRHKCLVQSNHGSVFVIPREKDIIRLYVQLEEKDVIDPVTGRVDKDRMGADQIFKVSGIHRHTIVSSHQYSP